LILPVEKFEKFTVAHVGSYYYGNTEIFLDALKILDDKYLVTPSEIRVLFVGIIDRDFQKKVEDIGLRKYIVFEDLVSHEEAIRIMVRSHLLLLIKGFNKYSEGHVPAKLYEYIAAKNKIICIGPKESEAGDIIRDLNAGIIVGNDVEELCMALMKEIDAYKNNQTKNIKYNNIKDFTSANMTNNLLRVLAEL
jgi:hypothetical protein